MKNRSFSALLHGSQSHGRQSLGNTSPGKTPDALIAPRNQPFGTSLLCGLLLALTTLGLTACHSNLFLAYKFPKYPFANRPVPPSKLAQRVMVSVANIGITSNGGSLAIMDAKRDIRSNIQNTTTQFAISGFSAGLPTHIYSYPEQLTAYVYSNSDGSLTTVDYGTEKTGPPVGTFTGLATSFSIPSTFTRYYSTEQTNSRLVVLDAAGGNAYSLNVPNVYKVSANTGDTVALAMVRNSNDLYQIVKLNANQYLSAGAAAAAPIIDSNGHNTGGINAVDCQPVNLPVYCAVKVPGNFDRPADAYYSPDGSTVYILNCGPECGGTTASITLIRTGALNINNVATYGVSGGTAVAVGSDPPGYVTNIPIPGGVTTAIADGDTLFVAGQQLQPDGLFAGNLSTVSLATNTVTGTYSISDGSHSKMLFADDNTLWIGSQLCSNGERAHLNQNYNCLTRFDLGAKTASIVPNVTPGGATKVPYPNTNLNPYYYGDLTGLCWVENFHKVYTAYGGQVHVFSTVDGSEINNNLVTVQGTALDVAYMDATTNVAN